ncbi:MAG: alpha/beta hydrolase domain-containing protein [Frankia sp.]
MLLVAAPTGLLPAGVASAAVGGPTVTGPVTGSSAAPSLYSTNFDLGKVGYEESEFFLSGTASSYTSATPLTSDGRWTVTADASAPYTTRAVIRRPVDPKKFNGTVVVEWLNVSGGTDAAPDWTLAHNELIREGFAWVGVSAQSVGVNAAKKADPARYAPLSHPGDSFSYDIFSQVGQSVRAHSALMLDGLVPHKLIAAGESQSAARLVTYINAVHPLVHVYDGFLVHSRFASGTPLSQAPQANVPAPSTTTLRNDLRVPVFVFETETDVAGSNLADRQPDTNRFRLWEVAGTSHFDYYGLIIGPADTGDGQGAVLNLAAMQNPPSNPPPGFACALPINTGGTHWVLDAAFHWLNQWVVKGIAPPIAQPLRTTGVSPVVFARDANGNVLGGVRSPQVDAPIAALGGVGNSGTGSPLGVSCPLFGTTVPFSASQLASLYDSHGKFVARWDLAALHNVGRGFLLLPDAVELMHSAAASPIGK